MLGRHKVMHKACENVHCAVDLGEVTVGDLVGWLVADTELEASRAPVNELDGTLGLEGGDSCVGIFGDNVTAVQQAGGHVLSVTGVALDHLVVGFEAGHGHLEDRVGLMGSLSGGDNGGVGNQREVDARVGNQVGLEFVQVDVERAIETERGRDRRDD